MRPLRWLLLGGVVLALGGACAGKSQDAEGIGGSQNEPPPGSAGSAGAGGTAGTGSTASGGTSTTDDDPPPLATRVPTQHRAAAEACDQSRAPGNADGVAYFEETGTACATDEECAGEVPLCESTYCPRAVCLGADGGGRCVTYQGQCLRDSDCDAGANGRCDATREGLVCSYDECFADSGCGSDGPCACGGHYGPDGPNTCMPGNCRTDADCGRDGYCSPTQGDCGSYSGIIAYYCHRPQDTCVNDSDCGPREQQGPGYCMYRPELGHWQCGYGQCVG
jgi:hypothetical protein